MLLTGDLCININSYQAEIYTFKRAILSTNPYVL